MDSLNRFFLLLLPLHWCSTRLCSKPPRLLNINPISDLHHWLRVFLGIFQAIGQLFLSFNDMRWQCKKLLLVYKHLCLDERKNIISLTSQRHKSWLNSNNILIPLRPVVIASSISVRTFTIVMYCHLNLSFTLLAFVLITFGIKLPFCLITNQSQLTVTQTDFVRLEVSAWVTFPLHCIVSSGSLHGK